MNRSEHIPFNRRFKHSRWLKTFLIGCLLYVITIQTVAATGNSNLFMTLVILGNFLVPVSFVIFFFERRSRFSISMTSTALCFLYGGLLGTVTASILEPFFIETLNFGTSFLVGLIEEFAKIIGVVIIAKRRNYNSYMDGIILGAAAGMGFAAFESTGYAFTAFLESGGSLTYTVFITLLRGFTAPVGHGTWTAILSGVMLNESIAGKIHINYKVLLAYLTVSTLHGLWNGLPFVIENVISLPYAVWFGHIFVGITGLAILYWQWRKARRATILS